MLLQVTEIYRLANEAEVEQFLQELKSDNRFEVAKYSSQKRYLKAKGEIIDEWIKFTVTLKFNDEKEPETEVKSEYEIL